MFKKRECGLRVTRMSRLLGGCIVFHCVSYLAQGLLRTSGPVEEEIHHFDAYLPFPDRASLNAGKVFKLL